MTSTPPPIAGTPFPMASTPSATVTAFVGDRLLLSGPLPAVALAVKAAALQSAAGPILIFDDSSGRVIDLDLRGTSQDIGERLAQPAAITADAGLAGGEQAGQACAPRGRGRPRLGVVAREVTLLPRHWDWLAAQPNGASAALRRLVEQARRTGAADQQRRRAQEAAYRFMLGMGGDLPGYEEGTRALFANDAEKLQRCIGAWPEDIRTHVLRLAFGSGYVTRRKARPGSASGRSPVDR